MFDLFRRKAAKDFMQDARDFTQQSHETYGIPPAKEVPPMPEEDPAKIFYRIGVTGNNRVSLQMGYSEITMNKEGVANMIAQLEVFMNQLTEEDNDGEPA